MKNTVELIYNGIKQNLSVLSILIVVTIYLFVAKNEYCNSEKKINVITWDGYGYYVYLPAIFIYKDIKEYKFVETHLKKYHFSDALYQIRTKDGITFPIYNIGLSVLWLPFFLIAHAFCKLSDYYTADGMSAPYQIAIIFASFFYLILGLSYLRRFLLLYINEAKTAIVIIAITLGTNYFYYFNFGKELTHIYLFSFYAVYLYYIKQYFSGFKRKNLILFSIVAGLMILIRTSEIIAFILPLVYKINTNRFDEKIKIKNKVLFYLIFFSSVVFLIQILYYKTGTGRFYIDGYYDHHFNFSHPNIVKFFFSYERGFFVYTPIMLIAVLGIYYMRYKHQDWMFAVLLFFIFNFYILCSWDDWKYGSTFGSRPVVQMYAILALPLGIVITFFWKKKLSWIISIIILLAIFLNLFQTYQFNKGIIPSFGSNKTYYWHSFFACKVNVHDKVLLELDQKYTLKNQQHYTVFNLENERHIYNKKHPEYLEYYDFLNYNIDAKEVNLYSDKWLEYKLTHSYYGDSYSEWNSINLITEIDNNDKVIYWSRVRLPYIIDKKDRDSITFFQKLPKFSSPSVIKVYITNNCDDSSIIHNLKVYRLK